VDGITGSLAASYPFMATTSPSLSSVHQISDDSPLTQSEDCPPDALPASTSGAGRQRQHSMQLIIPTPPFVSPPPMCMFFQPTFRDLQAGKVAVWKGDLTIRGRGGGTFNILIVGEEGSDRYW
jgi:hypothetical protein